MTHRDISSASKRFVILVGLMVVGLMSFGLFLSFYHNILFEETLKEITESNGKLRDQINRELDDLAYYRSRQYRDKYAKENLSRVNQGEHLIILRDFQNINVVSEGTQDQIRQERDVAYREYLEKIPILEHWKLYLFRSNELESLKETF